MKKIAVLGTCASEDWYHYQNPRQRLDVKLVPPYQQSAMVSLNSKPVPLPSGDLGQALGKEEIDKLKIDFDKSFFSLLESAQPDVLIVDLLLDSRRGVIRTGDGAVTNSYIIHRSSLRDRLDFTAVFNPLVEPDKYAQEFTASVRHLGAFLKSRLPQCRIILHKARWAEYYLDKAGVLHPFEPKKQINHFVANMCIRELEQIFEREITCDVISVQDVPTIADEQHIWGFLPLHYQKSYYHEFVAKLRPLLG